MPTLLNRLQRMSLGLVLFIFFFTIAAMGLNPAGKTSIAMGCVSLLFQISLFLCAIEYAVRDQILVSSVQYLYIINALCQLFIVRMFAKHVIAWIFACFYVVFPNFSNVVLSKVYNVLDRVFYISQVIHRNAVLIIFSMMGNIMNNPNLLSNVGLNFLWSLANNMVGGGIGVAMAAVNTVPFMLAETLATIPLFFIIPTEIVKYYVLVTVVKSHQLGNLRSGCGDIMTMAMVLSLPIANIKVVSSPSWKADMDAGGGVGVLTCSIAIIAAYMSSMISCGILGLAIAENSVLKRKNGMGIARIMSGLLICVVDVMTWSSALHGILTDNARIALSFTLLMMMIGTGIFVWIRAVQLMVDEHAIMTGRESER